MLGLFSSDKRHHEHNSSVAKKSTSHLILIEEHIWNRVAYGKPSRTLRTYQLSFHNVNLKERVVHLPEEALILLCKSKK